MPNTKTKSRHGRQHTVSEMKDLENPFKLKSNKESFRNREIPHDFEGPVEVEEARLTKKEKSKHE